MSDGLNQPWMEFPGGLNTTGATILPPGGRIAGFVRSGGRTSNDPIPEQYPIYTTLAAALAKCRASQGDIVYVLPGHTESVSTATMLDNLVAGTKIIGWGHGSLMPTFNWTATGSQWVLNDANVFISGLRLNVDGANGVVKAIVCTAADNTITGCEIRVASGAALKATIAMEVGTGAARFAHTNSRWLGTATHNVTDGLKVVGVVDGLYLANLKMIFSATAGNGNIHVTAAATNMLFENVIAYNTHTSSTANIALDDVACDGIFVNCDVAQKNDGTVTDQGVTFGTAALVQCSRVFAVDSAKKNSILSPAVET